MKKLILFKKLNYSTALMIDQRVSQGIESNFFNEKALTTTVPAQLVKKFKIPVVPIFIERINDINFKIVVKKPMIFDICVLSLLFPLLLVSLTRPQGVTS